jgi:hypothetical protein
VSGYLMLDPLSAYVAECCVRGCQSGFSVFIIINRARICCESEPVESNRRGQ